MNDDLRKKLNEEGWKIERRGLPMHYDRQGVPIGLGDFAMLMSDPSYRIVAQTNIDVARVSTIWLGIDHRFMQSGPPILFETMIFGYEFELDGYQHRYTTEEEARTGHDVIVAQVETQLGWTAQEWEQSDWDWGRK